MSLSQNLFIAGVVISLILGLFITPRFLKGFPRHIVRGLIFGIFVGPVYHGPEGEFVYPLYTFFPDKETIFYYLFYFDGNKFWIATALIGNSELCFRRYF